MTQEDTNIIKNMTGEELEKRHQNLLDQKNLLKPYMAQYQAIDYELSHIKDEIGFRHFRKEVLGKYFVNKTCDTYMYVAGIHYADNDPYCKCLVVERGETARDNAMYWDDLYIKSEYKAITQEVFMLHVGEILSNSLYRAGISVAVQKEESVCKN